LLDLDLESDVLFQGGIDLVRGELRQTLFEKMNSQFDIEVFLLEIIDVLGEPVFNLKIKE
jgi:hypothetical protein